MTMDQAGASIRGDENSTDHDALIHKLAHDLRSPVRGITQFAGLLRNEFKGELEPRAERLMEFILGGAEQVERLAAGLLAYARADAPVEDAHAVPLAAALRLALHEADMLDTRSGAALCAQPLPVVHGDGRRMRAVFDALLSNSREFARPDDELRLTLDVELRDGVTTLLWCDNGVGIDASHHQEIFQPFRRLCSWDDHPGAGLGLPTARRHVERHGGSLTLRASALGAGACFAWTLPHDMSS